MNLKDATLLDLENSSVSWYSTVVMFVSAGIIFVLYALMMKLPLLLAFVVVVFETRSLLLLLEKFWKEWKLLFNLPIFANLNNKMMILFCAGLLEK